MKQILLRHASDEVDAQKIAQGMENAGADVFSVTHDSIGYAPEGFPRFRDQKPHSSFIVWCKFVGPLTPDEIDEAISKMYEGE